MRFLFFYQQRPVNTSACGITDNETNIVTETPARRARRCFGAIVSLVFIVSAVSSSAETPVTLLRGQVRELLQKEALLKESDNKDHALTALCDLYVVLRKDERYSNSDMLQQDAAKIRRRLISSAKQKTAKLKRSDVPRPQGLSGKVDAAIKKAIDDAANDSDADSKSESSTSLVSQKTKPIRNGKAGAGGADGGWELVELMQRVVAPDFWDVNGGPGVIRYFAMRRVLVVRATTDVHEQVRDLLKSLPR